MSAMKYVLVTGGVVSGLGKGVTASSIGVLLKNCGFRVTAIKIDPYLNMDAGTMSPFEHGEVFVLDDGGEGDLDLGNYERFMDITLRKDNNITTGKIYQHVIERERRGDYLGKTVQVVPHITDAIQDWIERVAQMPVDSKGGIPDVCVIELGGTVGDIESMPFVEALRQFQFRIGTENVCVVHVSLVPIIGVVGEQKTKPTQHSVQVLRSLGLNPTMLACRCSEPLDESVREKLALFCHVPGKHVLTMHDVSNIWRVPLMLESQGAHKVICSKLGLPNAETLDLSLWRSTLADRWDSLTELVNITLIGKYTGLSDAYLSVIKSLQHACMDAKFKLKIDWVEATSLEPGTEESDPALYEASWQKLRAADGILVPGGFGSRGVEGKILAAEYARSQKVSGGKEVLTAEYARSQKVSRGKEVLTAEYARSQKVSGGKEVLAAEHAMSQKVSGGKEVLAAEYARSQKVSRGKEVLTAEYARSQKVSGGKEVLAAEYARSQKVSGGKEVLAAEYARSQKVSGGKEVLAAEYARSQKVSGGKEVLAAEYARSQKVSGGKEVLAAEYARSQQVPYLGICLGMQIAVIEFARNVLGKTEANSTEFDPSTRHPAVVFMPEGSTTHKGGTMRLGSRKTFLQTVNCTAAKLYQQEMFIDERHRHRYEVNPSLVPELEAAGLMFVGKDETGERMEILELTDNPAEHPFFVAAQFHPEFKSRPGKPSPLFLGFILASGKRLNSFLRSSSFITRATAKTPSRNASIEQAATSAFEASSISSPTSHKS
ncbi:hypothetical protein CEUSTIGMA_g3269.t1 [Chlamydomonas eustigma]|uniref:CTP synthase n=1 Tax=Chlamydomonas eustigma TaxID=1157962 RepID=A0A250WYG8_9CHLO|nr:hypothetical protein CEUSTIGMA_g3269.t1 [Chlamydomonas eustigma]|eukprot:GAX75826.1 hypothetical protein CEUSTIGMA_g3269.t1 [Chlamydomonas eustigma]